MVEGFGRHGSPGSAPHCVAAAGGGVDERLEEGEGAGGVGERNQVGGRDDVQGMRGSAGGADADAGSVARARGEIGKNKDVGVPLHDGIGVGQVAGKFGGRGRGAGRPGQLCAVVGGALGSVGDGWGFELLDVVAGISPGEVDGHELLLA
ncbi:hypothetical protein ACIQMR_37725 [Streptomyces sp. NPDC091376]|uniref:hypothetical protein n=1 Tax=Streptomyces sp. NPDC091376 TaxID=3365994 RepID=UPI0038183B8E